MEEEPLLVSVIVPVFNTSIKLLRRCFESVNEQSYSRIEIVFVDDGSTRDYQDFWDEILRVAPNKVVVVRQENGGVSSARNQGMRVAQGSLVTFIDPDDEFADKYCLEEAVRVLLNQKVDVVMGRVSYCFENVQFDTPFGFGEHGIRTYSTKEEIEDFEDYFLSYGRKKGSVVPNGLNRGPVARVFKKTVLQSIWFNEDLWFAEDAVFNAQVMKRCQSVTLVDTVWYRYYQYESSAVHMSKLNYVECHCGYVRNLTKDGMFEAAYWSHCRHLIIEATINNIRNDSLRGVKAVRAFINSPWAQQVFLNFDGERYEISFWERILVLLARKKKGYLFSLVELFGVQYLTAKKKKPIKVSD